MDNTFSKSGLFVRTADVKRPFKMSLEGFAGAGKSFTMAQVVLGVWLAEGKKKKVVLQDTEDAAKFFVTLFAKHGLIEGENFFVTPSRSLGDFGKILKLCEEEDAIYCIDTVTHLHENMVQEYLTKNKRTKLLLQDYMVVKPMWKELFSTPFVRSRCHIFFTGRAAWEYGMEENEETGKKEFFKSGVKMRGDNEVAFEPDLLVLMERVQKIEDGDVKIARMATVLKDRADLIDGKTFINPAFSDFEPVYRFLMSGGQEAKGQIQETPIGIQGVSDYDYWDRRKKVDIFLEEIEGLFSSYLPGQGPKEKKVKADIFFTVFQTRSKTVIEEMSPDTLADGKRAIEFLLNDLTSKGEWLAKMQEDKKQAFDLAKYIRERYDAWKMGQIVQDDDIPIFSADSDKGPPSQPEPPKEEPEPGQPVTGVKADPVKTLLSEIASISTRGGITEMDLQINKRIKAAGIKGDLEIQKICLAVNKRKKKILDAQT